MTQDCQALIIRDDPQRYEEVTGANRNKTGAPFQYAESLFAALAVVKSMTGLPYRHLQGSESTVTYQCMKYRNVTVQIAPFRIKCAKYSCAKRSIHHLGYDEDVFTCVHASVM